MQVACTGTEERLSECLFPQNFGIDYVYTPSPNDYFYYNENWPAPSHGQPNQASVANAPPPSNGLLRAGCDGGDARRLSVMRRSFEITGAASLLANSICLSALKHSVPPQSCFHTRMQLSPVHGTVVVDCSTCTDRAVGQRTSPRQSRSNPDC